MARGGGGKALFPFLAPCPGVGAKQEGAPSLEPIGSGCLTMLGWAGVSLGDHGTLSGCSMSLAEPGCPPVCPAPPHPFLAARGCGLRAALPRSLLQSWPGPRCFGVQHLPSLPCVLPFSSCLAPWASCGLPALPGEADAGGGAGWPGGARAAGRGC